MNRQHRERLVAKAMNRFFFQDNLAKNKIKTHRWRPDIVISRDPGSGGRPIAKKIASKLGWQLLDKKIMIKLAAKHGLPAKEFAKIDETSRNWFADTFNLLFNKNYLSDIRYLKHLKLLLMKSAKDGDVVIVSPNAGIRRGDRVVVRTKTGEVMVKQLRRRSARRIDLASFNADHDDPTFLVDDIDWIARVIWSTQ